MTEVNTEITKSADQIEKENQISESEKRIKALSEKVRLTSEERDEKVKLVEERDHKIAELERENAFNSGFAEVLGIHSAAKDHKDEIKEKVLKGYSVEDAALAVLGKAGKLGNTPPPPPPENPAGGSASTVMPKTGDKPLAEMTKEDKRAILEKALVIE